MGLEAFGAPMPSQFMLIAFLRLTILATALVVFLGWNIPQGLEGVGAGRHAVDGEGSAGGDAGAFGAASAAVGGIEGEIRASDLRSAVRNCSGDGIAKVGAE